jgi:hypothetical protein
MTAYTNKLLDDEMFRLALTEAQNLKSTIGHILVNIRS